MAVAPPLVVDGPPVQTLPYGLFSVAVFPPTDAQPHWQNGVQWETAAPCTAPRGVVGDPCSPGPIDSEGAFEEAAGTEVVTATPFVARGLYRCKSLSHESEAARVRALNALLAWEERQVEQTIASGGSNPSFRGALVLEAGPVSVAEGVDLLSGYLATSHHSVGVIHAPRGIEATLTRKVKIERRGQHLETVGGTLVVLGGGYDLAPYGPDGTPAPDGTAWLYATGRPVVYRSEPFFTPGPDNEINISNNDRSIAANRTYVVGWDCGEAAVLVSVTPEGA